MLFSFGGIAEEEKHYYYTTEWKDKLVDSDHFYIRTGHHNPKEMPIKSQIQIADEVKIGVFTLGMDLKKKFSDFVEITSDERPEQKNIKMHSGLYYHSADLWNPQVYCSQKLLFLQIQEYLIKRTKILNKNQDS